MNYRQIICLLFGILNLATPDQNYCINLYCKEYIKHIACGKWAWDLDCPSNAEVTNMQKFKEYIVEYHNFRRNVIAGGKWKDFPPAARMGTMSWNDKLAYIARYFIRKCDPYAKGCLNTEKYRLVGKNVGYIEYKKRPMQIFKDIRLIDNVLESWWEEYIHIESNWVFLKYPKPYKKNVHHFLLMVNDMNTGVGCAAAHYTKNNDGIYLMVCLYVTSNRYNVPVYVDGPPTSECTQKPTSIYKNLCPLSEVYNDQVISLTIEDK